MTLQQFLAFLKFEIFLTVLPLAGKLATALASHTGNPLALAADLTSFQVQVVAALPNLESSVAAALANTVNAEIQKLLTSAASAAGEKLPSGSA